MEEWEQGEWELWGEGGGCEKRREVGGKREDGVGGVRQVWEEGGASVGGGCGRKEVCVGRGR